MEESFELYKRGREALQQHDYLSAIQLFGQSVAIWPHFKALELLGECLCALGRHKEAVVPLAAATSLNDQVRAAALLSKALLATGERKRAVEIARRVLEKSPGNRIARQVIDANSECDGSQLVTK